MTFDDLWGDVKGLPEMAITQVPAALSESTKKKLCKLSPEEVTRIVFFAIEQINHGSIESLDTLIKKRI